MWYPSNNSPNNHPTCQFHLPQNPVGGGGHPLFGLWGANNPGFNHPGNLGLLGNQNPYLSQFGSMVPPYRLRPHDEINSTVRRPLRDDAQNERIPPESQRSNVNRRTPSSSRSNSGSGSKPSCGPSEPKKKCSPAPKSPPPKKGCSPKPKASKKSPCAAPKKKSPCAAPKKKCGGGSKPPKPTKRKASCGKSVAAKKQKISGKPKAAKKKSCGKPKAAKKKSCGKPKAAKKKSCGKPPKKTSKGCGCSRK